MQEQNLLSNEPHKPTGGEILGKFFMGLVIGLCMALLIFIMLSLVGGMFEQALRNRLTGNVSNNPLLPLILIIIAFFITLIGNIIIAGFYSMFLSHKYYDLSKMLIMTVLVNILLFFIFAPLYIVFYDNIENLFIVLAFHIFFVIFASNTVLEFITNPNYSAMYLIGGSLGLSISILVFILIYKSVDLTTGGAEQILLIAPPLLAYSLIPLLINLWERLYYKLYEIGNNFLYIPAISEVLIDEDEVEEVNVDDN